MTDWTEGYVADIGYTFGYYTELNPLRIRLAFANAGLVFPEIGTACELGFGQGMSTNIHAAASVVQWSGTDFNPSQAAFAQELAAASGSGARLFDDAFADFCTRSDLPDFDFISLHGIWSWISDENRAVIVDFIRRKLKVGGVLYISYNTLPGWASFAPMRHLMSQHAAVMGADGMGIAKRIDAAIGFADKLLGTNPLYVRANPAVVERLKGVGKHNRQYLAHEYFNTVWDPMYFADMAKWLAPAKVGYACSAHLHDHVDSINLTADQQAFLQNIPDAMLRQTVRDFMVNQQFRRDYWVKGARKLSAIDQAEAIRALRLMLVVPRADVSLKVNGSLGEAKMSEEIYVPLLDALSQHQALTVGELEQLLAPHRIGFGKLNQAVLVLAGAGHVALVQDVETIARARPASERLNRHLLQRSRGSADVSCLASPVTGAGVAVHEFHQLFLLCMLQGQDQPAQWAIFAWNLLALQGQRLVKQGKALETAEQNLAELTEQAHTFATKQLPILKALQVI